MLEKIKNYKPNNIVLFILAFIVAIVFWGWITVVQSPVETVVITDVPVTLSLPTSYQNSGYQIYGNSTYLVDVTISGKRFVVQEITAADLTATATTTAEISSGVQSLPIEVKTKESKMAKYEIVSLSKNSVSVFFDKPETRNFPVKININSQAAVLSEDVRIGTSIPSAEEIKVTGPSTELDKISYVLAAVTLSGNIEESKSYTPTVSLESDDESVEFKYSEIVNDGTFNVLVQIEKKKELQLNAKIEGIPDGTTAEISFSQPSALFWIPFNEKFNEINTVTVATLNYNDVKNNTRLKINREELPYEMAEEINLNYTILYR